jgi:hypothetical protein
MGHRSVWQDGRRAWARLNGWHQPDRLPKPARTPNNAIAALADIRLVRDLLAQAEFNAVKEARAGGKSWSEIATMLGVTKQSAWERWRGLDGDQAAAPNADRTARLSAEWSEGSST